MGRGDYSPIRSYKVCFLVCENVLTLHNRRASFFVSRTQNSEGSRALMLARQQGQEEINLLQFPRDNKSLRGNSKYNRYCVNSKQWCKYSYRMMQYVSFNSSYCVSRNKYFASIHMCVKDCKILVLIKY